MALMIPRERKSAQKEVSDGRKRTSAYWRREKFWFVRGHASSWDIFSCSFHIKLTNSHKCKKKLHPFAVLRPPMDNSPDLRLYVFCNLTQVVAGGHFSGCIQQLGFLNVFQSNKGCVLVWKMDRWLSQQLCHMMPRVHKIRETSCSLFPVTSFPLMSNGGN